MTGLSGYLQREFEEKKWHSIREAARNLDMHHTALRGIINNPNRIPELETLQHIAKGLGVPLRRLIEACGFPVENAETDDLGLTDQERYDIISLSPEKKRLVLEMARQLRQQP